MNIFTLLTATTLIFTGCSNQNGFTKFELKQTQERALESIQNSKIISGQTIKGVINAIYLNEVYPQSYNEKEYFFISVYLKDAADFYDEISYEASDLRITLNDKLPLKIKELPKENQFSGLIDTDNDWKRYYLIAFEKEESKKISLLLTYGMYKSSALIYTKNRE